MSGRIVAEVLAASASGQLQASNVSTRGFMALIAIASRVGDDSRQASVRWDDIRAGLYGASLSTAKRAVADLRSAGVLELVKRGFDNQHGRSAAPIYRITQLGERVTQVTHSLDGPKGHLSESVAPEPTGHPGDTFAGGRTGQIEERTGHPGDLLDGPIDEKPRARAPLPIRPTATSVAIPRCTGVDCTTCAIIAKAIDDCNECDQYGRDLYEHTKDCPNHGNFRQHIKRRRSA